MNRQSGQALPLGITLIMFSTLIGLVLFNTGQLVTEKTRLTNAADAAVYSGLVWQARALNFQSYTNRAMVANQVSMAQAVSLRSWSLYGVVAAEQVNEVLGKIPFVGIITNALETVMVATEQLLAPITSGLLSFVNSLNSILGKAQSAMYATTFVATPEIVRQVVRKNDDEYSVDTAFSIAHSGLNAKSWMRFTEQYEEDHLPAVKVRAEVINSSRDQFTTQRDWDFFNHWLYIAPFVKVNILRRGETRLVASEKKQPYRTANGDWTERVTGIEWEWKGKDTMSLQLKRRTWRGTKRTEVPIGWGQAYANTRDSKKTIETSCHQRRKIFGELISGKCESWLGENVSAEHNSDINKRTIRRTESREKMSATYTGIRAYRDLANLGAQEKDPRLELRVELERPLSSVMTSTKHGIGQSFLAPDSAAAAVDGDRSLASIASAEVYFKKPVRSKPDGHIEYANGYNPFWDVRLTNTPDATRIYALLTRGVPLVSSAVPSTGEALTQYIESAQSRLDFLNQELTALHSKPADTSGDTSTIDLDSVQRAELEAEIANIEATLQSTGGLSGTSIAGVTAFNTELTEQAQQLANDLEPDALQYQLDSYIRDEIYQLGFDPVELVESKIQEELEHAMSNILAGAVEGAMNSAAGVDVAQVTGSAESLVGQIGDSVDQTVSSLEYVLDDVEVAIEAGAAEAARVEAEFKRIEQSVTQIFEEKKQTLLAEADQVITSLSMKIEEVQKQLTQVLTDDEQLKRELELADFLQQREDVTEDSKRALAELLVDVVNSSTDIYEMGLDTAISILEMSGDVGSNLIGLLHLDCNEETSEQSGEQDGDCEF